MATIPVGVIGARGKMGREVCQAVEEAVDLELVARVGSGDSWESLEGAAVLVDFTHPDVVMDHVRWGVSYGKNVVVGTSGIDEGRLQTIRGWLPDDSAPGVIVAPNFCISAVLAMTFAARAAPHFGAVEIVDLAHRGKSDAPSGTALHTAQLIEQARRVSPGTSKVHSIRLDGLMFHQEVMMSRPGEILTIRFDTTERAAYMSGVLLAIRAVPTRRGLTVGLDALLDLQGDSG